MALFPNQHERSYLRFLVGGGHFWLRYLVAGVLFTLGFWLSLAGVALPLGLLVILLGHLPLWVRHQKLAPAPVDPLAEPVWSPASEDWHQQIEDRLAKGRRWDQSFWDITSPLVLVTLSAFITVGFVVFVAGAALFNGLAWLPFCLACAALWGPLFVNGIKAPWHPNQLTIKAKALEPVAAAVEEAAPGRYDLVPLLGLMEGKRGRYPMDVRVMLRPKEDDDNGFIGVQVQACLNNVQGKNYPYVYCVVLGKTGYNLRSLSHPPLVVERDTGDGVIFLVVRQHADRRGGWHTPPDTVAAIVRAAVELAERARRANA
ncbi:MAG: hypothetical protein ABIO70_36595 [Pseudomonadota bacterium]